MFHVLHVGRSPWLFHVYEELERKMLISLIDKKRDDWVEQMNAPFLNGKDFEHYVAHNTLQLIKELKEYVKKKKCDILHVHNCWSHLIASAKTKKPFILLPQGKDIFSIWKRFWRRYIFKRYTKKASTIVTYLPSIHNFLRNVNFNEEIKFVPNAIDINRFRPKKKTLELEGDPVIFMPARLARYKGHTHAFLAIQELYKEFPKLRFYCINSGIDAQYLQHFANTHKIPIRFIAPIYHENINEWYNAADIVYGYFGDYSMAILNYIELEAMSCERPVITHFNFREYYKERVPIFNARVSKEIAFYTSLLINDENLRKNIGRKSRRFIESECNPRDIISRYLKFYEEAAEMA